MHVKSQPTPASAFASECGFLALLHNYPPALHICIVTLGCVRMPALGTTTSLPVRLVLYLSTPWFSFSCLSVQGRSPLPQVAGRIERGSSGWMRDQAARMVGGRSDDLNLTLVSEQRGRGPVGKRACMTGGERISQHKLSCCEVCLE